jgi:hypothetical protein
MRTRRYEFLLAWSLMLHGGGSVDTYTNKRPFAANRRVKHAKIDVCSLSHTFSFVRRFISGFADSRRLCVGACCLSNTVSADFRSMLCIKEWEERSNLQRPTKPSATTKPSPEKPRTRTSALEVQPECSIRSTTSRNPQSIEAKIFRSVLTSRHETRRCLIHSSRHE